MSDLISRQDAIDAINDLEQMYIIEDGHDNLLGFAKTKIWALPSAQLERKTGRWKLIEKAPGFPDWICSECGGSGRGDYFYCPWCQVKMEEEHD